MLRSFYWRMLLAAALMVCGFTFMSIRLVQVQWLDTDRVAGHAPSLRHESIPSKRGAILDRQGDLLAGDQLVRDIVVDPVHLKDKHYVLAGLARAAGVKVSKIKNSATLPELEVQYKALVANRLAQVLDSMDEAEIYKIISGESMAPIMLAKHVPESMGAQVEDFLKEQNIRGVYCYKKAIRLYPSRNNLVHVIGYLAENKSRYAGCSKEELEKLSPAELAVDRELTRLKGRSGVEAGCDTLLTGTDGFRMVQRDLKGKEIVDYRGEVVPPEHGRTVRLTVDMALQKILEECLDEAVGQFSPERVSAVIMRPHTGEVLAVANRPHFDRSTMEGTYRDLAVSFTYEPGSTMKLFTFAAAFDSGVISPHTSIFCENGSMSHPVPLTDVGSYGNLTANEVIAKSSNIGTYKVAIMLGSNRLHQYLSQFGFGKVTGIRTLGEVAGRLPAVSQWSGTSLSRVSIGYETTITPMQLAAALGAIANGGEYFPPMLIKSHEDDQGNLLEHFVPESSRRVISEVAADKVKKAMVDVILTGTGKRAATSWPAAGKTGTSKKWITDANGKNGYYSDARSVCSFAGFVPADNPEFTITIMIDDPSTGAETYGGSTVAAPVFASIAERAMSYSELNREVALNGAAEKNEERTP